MTTLSDQLMVRYLDSGNVDLLLAPAADTTHQRVRALLAEVYDTSLLTIESVDSVTVKATSFQVPLVEPVSVNGTWEKVIPSPERSLLRFELPSLATENWIDMSLETTVSVHVSVSQGALDAISSEDVSELSQQEFLSKFAFMDLPALMTTAGVSTYGELQAEFPRLYRLAYAQPPAFNRDDPTTRRTFRLRVAVLFFPTADLEGALRRLNGSRRALNELRPHTDSWEGGAILSTDAWMAVFPASAFTTNATPITQGNASALLGAAGYVAAFETL